jgi:two-component system cell cycle response regulator DivK
MAKVLIIEDDPHSADILSRILKRRDHEVVHVSEGLTGLKVIREEAIDLILLDLGLPDIGGHTIAALINRLPGDIPIIAVTGSTDYATERRAMVYGCDGYVTKPINTRTFVDQIEKFIEEKNGQSAAPDSSDTSQEDTSDTGDTGVTSDTSATDDTGDTGDTSDTKGPPNKRPSVLA